MSTSAELKKSDNLFIHPWDDIVKIGGHERTLLDRGEGVYVYDSEGNRLLDAPAGMWCVNIGHGREEMAQAVYDQIMALTYVSPWSMTTGPAAEFAAQIAEQSPGDLNHVFFTTGGSTAVDSALRFVQFYNNIRGLPNKKHIIAQKKGYHGSTYLCGSVSGKARDKSHLDFETRWVHHIESPHPLHRPAGQSDAEFLDACVANLENMIDQVGPENCAVFVAEPIQASGGVIVPPDGYHKRCLEVCRRHDMLYLSDEVVTAFGRLGHCFASQDVFGITPDIITTAKGLTSGYIPMGAFLVSDRLIQEVKERGGDSAVFSNGFTYSGHPVAAAAGIKNLEIIQREKLFEQARETGPYLQQQMQSLRDISIVSDVRGMGLMACVECELEQGSDDLEMDLEIGKRIDRHCQAMGLIVRPIINMCVMSPPLTITRSQIDEMVAILRKGIIAAMQEVSDQRAGNESLAQRHSSPAA
ncbi:MAG: aminotransferase [Gammaproteobacteria bacterium]|nr:aminotransferase [Gammaproteobacteria bacterium]MDH3447510.1 aminotransferase [Gammaproteobacteria bacterium]